MHLKRDYKICLFVAGCILLNYAGRMFASVHTLPAWFDSIGTVIAAYALGPFCGAVVGAAVNIIFGIHAKTALVYGLTNVVVGITVGISARKGYMKHLFGALSTAFFVTVLSAALSTPLNYMFADGSTGNVWGDGVITLLQEIGFHGIVSHFVGEFYLDFLDKILVILSLYLLVRLHKKIKLKIPRALFVSVLFICVLPQNISAKEESADFSDYVQTVYNGDDGLIGGEANDIAETKDGILWIGTYGGLYRYSGREFCWMNEFPSVKTVNCLYTDEAGRLWIGTNDNGLSICIDQEISNVVNKDSGLPSNSVRCITESADGNYYVGTTDCLVVMTLSGGLKVQAQIPEIMYADSICADADGNIAVVTEAGDLYLVQGTKIVAKKSLDQEGSTYNCCTFDSKGILYAGTSGNLVEMYQIREDSLWKSDTKICTDLKKVNSLQVSEDDRIYVCADNGAGYFDQARCFHTIDTGSFDGSIEHMLTDYQGNLWFASSRLGLLRLCPSVFTEIYEIAGLERQTVNTVTKWQNRYYFGTDQGIDVVDEHNQSQMEDGMALMFAGIRVRCLFVDSQDHLWAGTSGKGLWEIDRDGTMVNYEEYKQTAGENYRFVTELKDHTIAAGGDSGITLIRNGKISDTIGMSEGLSNPKVLCLCEREDGLLYAGTDGNGIAVIKDGVVTDTFDQDCGLSSEIILKMIPEQDGEGMFIVTGNGLCYMDEKGTIRSLTNFPYYNNYDLVEGEHGEVFVLSSAGIYIVEKEDLLNGKTLNYELLESKQGLRLSLTPNAWNYLDEWDNLYLSGDRGVVSINLSAYEIRERSYRMLLQTILVDGESYPVEKGETVVLPRDADRVEIIPEVVNYSINDPKVRVWLEGFDKTAGTMLQSQLSGVVYTNLPAGSYTFHVAVLNSRADHILAETTYKIEKEKEINDNWWFRVYVGVVAAVIVWYLGWLFFRTQIQKTIRMQKMELEWTKKQLQMGNEMILTIAQTVDAKDASTSEHSLRVAKYSVLIAKRLGYSEEECEDLRKMAILHDIGKIAIPDRVLNKPEKLTDEEYALMKSHVVRGAEILKNFTWIEHVADGALYHHERYDGNGYVHGLKGEEIPLNARIIGIADAFDAMTANRIYRQQMDLIYVLGELQKGRGTQFDPKLSDIFLELLEDGTIDLFHIYQTAEHKEQPDERKEM